MAELPARAVGGRQALRRPARRPGPGRARRSSSARRRSCRPAARPRRRRPACSASRNGRPPSAATFISLPPETKPIHFPSGEKKGPSAAVGAGNRQRPRARRGPGGRGVWRPPDRPEKTRLPPSGEKASVEFAPTTISCSAASGIESRSGSGGAVPRRWPGSRRTRPPRSPRRGRRPTPRSTPRCAGAGAGTGAFGSSPVPAGDQFVDHDPRVGDVVEAVLRVALEAAAEELPERAEASPRGARRSRPRSSGRRRACR